MKVSDVCKIADDCSRFCDILRLSNRILTDMEMMEIADLLWDYREELLKKEVK